MSSVRFRNLTKVFPGDRKHPEVTALKGIDLEIRDHEFMVLVGPSGCGKTTTLRMLAGLESVTEGECFIGEQMVNGLPPKDRNIAMVFQNFALYPHMTVFENLAFGLKLQKLPMDELRNRVHEAAEILGLSDLLNRKPKALSGGQRQRVAVGRAMVRKPQVFLFDEPLSNLDAKMRVQMRAEISKLHARLDATMIYVTHDQVEAMTLGDRICVMNEGKIMQVDTPLELYNRPQNLFVAGFIGSPSMNFLNGRLRRTGASLQFAETGGELVFDMPQEDENGLSGHADNPVVLGIRPEHLIVGVAAESDGFEARVEVIEPMGSETFLYLSVGTTEMVAKVPADHSIKAGEIVRVRLDLAQVHYFDPATEKVIS